MWTRFCTSNGMMVAAALGTRLTTPAILSAVRSCSSLPSSEKLRLGKIAVTCVPGCFRFAADQLGGGPGQPPVRTVDELQRHVAIGQPGDPQLLRLRGVDDEVNGAHDRGPQAFRVPQRGHGGQVEVIDEDDDHPAGVVRLTLDPAG